MAAGRGYTSATTRPPDRTVGVRLFTSGPAEGARPALGPRDPPLLADLPRCAVPPSGLLPEPLS